MQSSLSSPPSGDGKITVSNVFDLPKDQAVAALRAAGHQGDVGEASGRCGSVVDGRVIEIGHVCAQQPSPGSVQGARLPIALRVQDEDPWHGDVGRITEWYLMPRLVGMAVDAARAELLRIGFRDNDRVQVQWVDRPGCKPLTVCETYPEAMERAGVHSGMVLSAARDPSASSTSGTAAKPDGGSR
jgi:beta-lactam-binding protein with PASTA domain